MFDRDDNYNPAGDYYGPQEEKKSFKDSVGDALGFLGGGASVAGAYAGSAGNTGKEMAKKIIPLAIVGIIVLVVIGGIFWVLSQQQQITFTIKELDGGPLELATIRFFSSADPTEPVNQIKRGATQQITLPYGEYTYKINEQDHEIKSGELTVGQDTPTSITYELVKDVAATIQINFTEKKIFTGQKFDGDIIITNNSGSKLTGEILNKDVAVKVEFPNKTFDISGNSAISLPFTITGEKVNEETDASSIISIKGTKISEKITLKAFPTVPASDITISPTTYKIENLEAGVKNSITSIKISNKNKNIPIENLKITITPETVSPESQETLSWFELSGSDPNTPYTITIDSILPGKVTDAIQLYITPDITSEIGDFFNGILTLESPSIASEKTFIMIYKVSKKRQTKTEFTPQSSIKINCSTTTGCLQENNIILGTLKNSGNQDLGEIKLEIDTTSERAEAECSWYTLKINQLSSLVQGDSYKILADLYPGATTKNSILCYLMWNYIDPTNNERINQDLPIKIEVNTTK